MNCLHKYISKPTLIDYPNMYSYSVFLLFYFSFFLQNSLEDVTWCPAFYHVTYSICSLYHDRYFAVGSADSLVSLWDISEMLCVRTFTKLEWVLLWISYCNHLMKLLFCSYWITMATVPFFFFLVCCLDFNYLHSSFLLWPWFVPLLRSPVRTISFNHTGEYLACASEDWFIDIVSIV